MSRSAPPSPRIKSGKKSNVPDALDVLRPFQLNLLDERPPEGALVVVVKRDVELLPAVGEDAADFAVVGVGGQLLPLGVGGINPRHQVVVLPVVVRGSLDAPLLPGVVQAGKLLLKLRQVVLGDALRGVLKAQEVHLLADMTASTSLSMMASSRCSNAIVRKSHFFSRLPR